MTTRAKVKVAAVAIAGVALGGCGSSPPKAVPSPSPASPSPVVVIPSPSASASSTATPTATPAITCANDQGVAYDSSLRMPGSLTGDIDGDGQVDQVYLALDRTAPQGCQAFLVVQTPNSLLSSPVSAWESLGGLPSPRLHSLIQLNRDGEEVVVDVLAGASTQFVSVFTVVDGRLQPMSAPGVQTAGGVTTFPYSGSVGHVDGEDCTTDGHIEIVSASPKGNKYDVNRRVYSAQGAQLKPLPSLDRTTTATFGELSRLPGFAFAPFGDCRP